MSETVDWFTFHSVRRLFIFWTAAWAAVILSLATLAGAALADGSTTSTPAPKAPKSTKTTPKATEPTPPAPPKATARLYLNDTFTVHRDSVTVPGRSVEIRGFVRPYIAGQSVQMEASVDKQVFKQDRLAVKPEAGRPYGSFSLELRAPKPGIVRVQVTHRRSAAMGGFFAERAYAALNTQASFGDRGPLVDLVQQQLAALHVFVPQSGVYNQRTGLALNAYHRLLGWGEGNQSLDGRTITALLNGQGAFRVRYPGDGKHAEGDLANQTLALINGSQVYRIYPISSGKPSTPTVLGRYQVYYRVPGYLPDGMYYSSFFYRGYAIHGYDPAPDYPASHGCMRLPIIDAIGVFHWLNYGDRVDVYR